MQKVLEGCLGICVIGIFVFAFSVDEVLAAILMIIFITLVVIAAITQILDSWL
jgi:hypothetical protein